MPAKRTDNTTKHKAIQLRHAQTPAEVKLWRYLRAGRLGGFSFRRQHAIGPFITDFCCIKAKLVIELDGWQHMEQEEYDADRTKYLQSKGFRLVRFWNSDVMNDIDAVIQLILGELQSN